MELTNISLLIALLLVHFIADFLLQTQKQVEEKNARHWKSFYLYIHGIVHTLLTYAVFATFGAVSKKTLMLSITVGATHTIIDLVKSYLDPKKLKWFALDQILHILILIVAWALFLNIKKIPIISVASTITPEILLLALSYFVVIWPMGIIIGLIVKRWIDEIKQPDSLEGAGLRIGQIERVLILTFVLADQFAAIGFLLAAKSVLRFGSPQEAEHRKINEYILLGTITSFAITIVFGLFIKELVKLM